MDKKREVIFYTVLGLVFCLGIFLHLSLFSVNNVFDDDECRMCIAMYGTKLRDMLFPLGAFSTAPLFMFFSKIIAEATNYSEHALKIIPLTASLISIFVFYKISREFFSRRYLSVVALFLYVTDKMILQFSSTFKNYSIEVLVGLLCLYYFYKLDINKLTVKQTVILSIVLALLPIISLPSVFFIGVMIFINLWKNFKNKEFYKKLAISTIPLAIINSIFYFYYLKPLKIMQMDMYDFFWKDFVWNRSFFDTFKEMFMFAFQPNGFTILQMALFIISASILLFNKKCRTDINIFIILLFCVMFLMDITHLYPLYSRVILFLVPILILVMIKIFDVLDFKKPYTYIMIFLLIYAFKFSTNPIYLKNIILYPREMLVQNSPKDLLFELNQKYDPKKDDIVVNEASMRSYMFYVQKYKLSKMISGRIVSADNYDNGKKVYDYLNKLDNNHAYWFYLINDFYYSKERAHVMNWLFRQNIEYMNKDLDSYIIYIVPPIKYYNPMDENNK